MIIYGTRSKHITSKKIPATCTSCEQDDMYIAVYGSYAHVMWIPFFPLGKRVYSYCGHCKNELESTAMPKELRIKARDIKSKSTTPKWFFSGSILLILIIVGEIVNGFIKEKNGFVTHKDYIIYFNNCLMGFLQENELEINNIKQFKNEVATFIYKSSEEPDNAMY